MNNGVLTGPPATVIAETYALPPPPMVVNTTSSSITVSLAFDDVLHEHILAVSILVCMCAFVCVCVSCKISKVVYTCTHTSC